MNPASAPVIVLLITGFVVIVIFILIGWRLDSLIANVKHGAVIVLIGYFEPATVHRIVIEAVMDIFVIGKDIA